MPPQKKHNELKAGLFVIAALVVLTGLVIWMGGYLPGIGADRHTAWFYSEVAAGPVGLIENKSVHYGDMTVGRVTGVIPDYDKGRVYFKVQLYEDDCKLFSDGVAEVISGMLGDSVLAIKDLGGSSENAIPASTKSKAIAIEPGGMQAALNNMRSISARLKDEFDTRNSLSLLSKVRLVMERLEKTAANIEQITGKMVPEMDFAKKGSLASLLKQSVSEIHGTTSKIHSYTEKDLGFILAKARKVSTSILETANNLNVASREAKELLLENSDSLDRMIDDMTMLAADLKATGKEVRRNPWMLLYQPSEKETKEAELFQSARAFETAATELRVVVARLEALKKLSPDDKKADREIDEVRKYMLNLFEEFRKVEGVFWKRLQGM